MQAFGLAQPEPDEPYFTPEEAQAFRELGRLDDIWPRDVRLEISRVYGQALGRIAQTELHLASAAAAGAAAEPGCHLAGRRGGAGTP